MRQLNRIPSWYFTGALQPHLPLSLKYRRIIGVISEFGRVLNERIAFPQEEEPQTNRFDRMQREVDSSIGLIADITLQSTDGLQIDYAVRSGKPVLLIKESETMTSSMLTDWAKMPMPPPNLSVKRYHSNDSLEHIIREFCRNALEKNPLLPGAYIVIEGGDGCGKSVQRELLGKYLREKGWSVVEKREPGGTRRGEIIRKILQDPDIPEPMTPEAELFLFSAGRCLLFESEILPAMKRGDIFLSDRCFYATDAYQGYGRMLGLAGIDLVNSIAMRGTRPDLGIIIDIDPEIGLQKATTTEFGKKDRFEQEKLDFHQRVRQGYLEVARRENNVHVVPYIPNGINEMHCQIKGIVDKFLSENYGEK